MKQFILYKLFLNNFFKLTVVETYEVISNKKGKVIFDILKVLISYSRGAEASMLHRSTSMFHMKNFNKHNCFFI